MAKHWRAVNGGFNKRLPYKFNKNGRKRSKCFEENFTFGKLVRFSALLFAAVRKKDPAPKKE
jgi:hypothetical protein